MPTAGPLVPAGSVLITDGEAKFAIDKAPKGPKKGKKGDDDDDED